MRIAVTGTDGAVGRGVAASLSGQGHDVVCPSDVGGADVVVHCAWTASAEASAKVVEAVRVSGNRRIVFASSAHGAEDLLKSSGAEWVNVRCGAVLGRDVDDRLLRLLGSPLMMDASGAADRRLQVIHPDDVRRFLVRAALDREFTAHTVDLATRGDVTLRDLAAVLGRPLVRGPGGKSLAIQLGLLSEGTAFDDATLREVWGFIPAWSAPECVQDVALAVRGRVGLGGKLFALPWRLAHVRSMPAIDAKASDGVVPVLAGPVGGNGEFDTPIDPRFPTFVATNLSEALPGPFSPSSASVTVQGARAGGVTISERLRPGGVVQQEMATRTVGVFGHRLYAAVTSAHFMAQTVPFTDPMLVLGQFFGRGVVDSPIFGPERPPHAKSGVARQIRNVGIFAGNLVGLSAGSVRDSRDFVADVERLERATGEDLTQMDDGRLLSLILSARDHVVHGWVLASASIMLCSAYSVILRLLSGRDTTPSTGPDVISAQSLDAIRRLVVAARQDPVIRKVLAEPGEHLGTLAVQAPQFYSAIQAELSVIGHRGPAEVEMSSPTYADDPELLVRMVEKSLDASTDAPQVYVAVPRRARPVVPLAARQLRDREVRRDKMVRAIWVLRRLLREQGARMAASGVIDDADDVFYLLVDELEAPPPDVPGLVARRRTERRLLADVVPPTAFCGRWESTPALAADLAAGQSLHGLGVCGGRARGRVRIVRPDTIDDLQPGEVLVAAATDVGYTPAFGYAAAVVTELGGPMSHAAIVAREFGFPCVVDARGATQRLAPGTLVEVDGATGEIRVLDAEVGHVG